MAEYQDLRYNPEEDFWAGYGKEPGPDDNTIWDWEQGRRVPIGQTMADQWAARTPTAPRISSTPTPFYRNFPASTPQTGQTMQSNISQYYAANPIPSTTPVAPPTFRTLKQSEGEIRQEQQTQAAPVISKLRQALRQVSAVAANEDNPARRKMMLRSLMEGTGSALSETMTGAYSSAMRRVGADISISNQAESMSYETRARQAAQSDAARLGAWQSALMKIISAGG